MSDKMVRLQMLLPQSEKDRLSQIAEANNITLSSLIRIILSQAENANLNQQ